MTGNSIIPQVLGASTVAGVSLAALPKTGGAGSIFGTILICAIVVCAIVVISRLAKHFLAK